MYPQHLQGILDVYFAKVAKTIKIIKPNKCSRLKCL